MNIRSLILSALFVVCFSISTMAKDLTVAVAANVQYTFEEIRTAFEQETGIPVTGVIGSSGKFTAQIENGAPFDVFLSADMEYPKALAKERLTHNDPRVYAYGTLVLWTMDDRDLFGGVAAALTDPSVRKIAIASPATAPYGRAAVNALKHLGVYNQIQGKLIYGESIAQTNQFITTKAANLGFTARSIVMADNMKDKGRWIEVDKGTYDPIAQGAVILKNAEKQHLEQAQKFFDFLFSDEAAAIFKKYGYILP